MKGKMRDSSFLKNKQYRGEGGHQFCENSLLDRGNFWNTILRVMVITLIGLTCIYRFTIFSLGYDSDLTALNMLVREQRRTGELVPDTWNCATTLPTVSLANVIMLLLAPFIKNQWVLLNTTLCLEILVFIFVLWYYAKKQVKTNLHLVFLCLFLSSIPLAVQDAGIVNAYYLVSIIDNLLLLILMTGALKSTLEIKSKVCFIALLIVTAFFTTRGTLEIAFQTLPLIGGLCLYLLFEHGNKQFSEIKDRLPCWAGKILILTAAAGAGYCISIVIEKSTGFGGVVAGSYPATDNLPGLFVQIILTAIGYKANVAVFSLAGIENVLAVVSFVGAVVCCVLLLRKYTEQPFTVKLMIDFVLVECGILIYLLYTVYSISGIYRYFFRPLMLIWLLAAYYVSKYVLTKGFFVKVITIIFLGVYAFIGVVPNVPLIPQYPEGRARQTALVDFLRENDLKYGYATYWNAGKNMVLSNFDVEIGGIILSDPIQPHYWMSSDISYDPDNYAGETFLLLTKEENGLFSGTKGFERLGTATKVLEFENYIIYVYSYNIAQNNFHTYDYQHHLRLLEENDQLRSVSTVAEGNDMAVGNAAYGQLVSLPFTIKKDTTYKVEVTLGEKTDFDDAMQATLIVDFYGPGYDSNAQQVDGFIQDGKCDYTFFFDSEDVGGETLDGYVRMFTGGMPETPIPVSTLRVTEMEHVE